MVLGEIGEGDGREFHAIQAMLLQPMGGGLHGEMGHTLAREGGERLVNRHRIGRGMPEIERAGRTDCAERTEAGSLQARAGPDLAEEIDAGTLAIGAGDGDHGARLVLVEARGGPGEPGAGFRRDEQRHIAGLDSAAGDNGQRALLQCGGDEIMAIGGQAFKRDENGTRLHLPAVRRQACHRVFAFLAGCFCTDELFQFHSVLLVSDTE